MKKLFLLLFVAGGLQAMDELPEGYGKEDCLLEMQQMELAFRILDNIEQNKMFPKFQAHCPNCGEYEYWGPSNHSGKKKCEKCDTTFTFYELENDLKKKAVNAITNTRRALVYKQGIDK